KIEAERLKKIEDDKIEAERLKKIEDDKIEAERPKKIEEDKIEAERLKIKKNLKFTGNLAKDVMNNINEISPWKSSDYLSNLLSNDGSKGVVDGVDVVPVRQEQDDALKTLRSRLMDLKKITNVLNSDTFFKVVSIMSEKLVFSEFFKNIVVVLPGTNENDFISKFFLSSSDYNDIFKILYGNNYKNNKKIKRDTEIYNQYHQNIGEEKFVFIYTVLHDILEKVRKEGLPKFLENQREATELTYFIITIQEFVKYLEEIYKKFNLTEKKALISSYYSKILDKYKNIFTFVKIRVGKKEYTDKYLLMKYINNDKRLGFKDDGPMTKFDEAVLKADLKNEENKENEEYYFFGAYDMIFMKSDTNKQIANEMSFLLMDKINKGENIITVLLGKSGAGKTSTGILFLKKEGDRIIETDGVIIELMNTESFVEKFQEKGLTLKMRNVYVVHGIKRTSLNDIKSDTDYKVDILKYKDSDESKFFYIKKDAKWYYHTFEESTKIYTKTDVTLAMVINYALETREVEPTVNNPDSSRSALLLEVKCENKNGDKQSIIMWDLPGSERLKCRESLASILRSDDSYFQSLKYGVNSTKEINFDNYACKQQRDNDEVYNQYVELESKASEHFNTIHQFEDNIDPQHLEKYFKIDLYQGNKPKSIKGQKENSKCVEQSQKLKECSKILKFKNDAKFMEGVETVDHYFTKLEELLKESEKNLLIWRNVRNVFFLIKKMDKNFEKNKKVSGFFEDFQNKQPFKHLFVDIFAETGSETLNSENDSINSDILTETMKDKLKKIINVKKISATDFLSQSDSESEMNKLNYLTMAFAYQVLLKDIEKENKNANNSITIGKKQMSNFKNFTRFKNLFLDTKIIKKIK
ncbi:MAG: hypothetical protein RL498_692, partial [Pseudomonadota bacterium]